MSEESSTHSQGGEHQLLEQRLAEAEAVLRAALEDQETIPVHRLAGVPQLLQQARQAMGRAAQHGDWTALEENAVQRTAELQQTNEELQVAEEEHRQQNQELLTTRTALEVERGRYQELFDLAPVGYLVTDPYGTIEEANQAAAALLGAPQHFLTGKPLPVFAAGGSRHELQHRIRQLREGAADVPDPWQLQLQSREGGPFDAHLSVVAIQEAGGEGGTIGLRWLIRDVTEQRQAEAALRASEERLRLVAEFTHDWEYWTNPDGQYVYVSPSCERITGYAPADFLEDPELFLCVTHPDDRPAVEAHLKAKRQGQQVQSMDFRILTRSGEERWINHVCQPVHGSDGSWMGYRGSNRDITDRVQVEQEREQLLVRVERLATIIESTPDLVSSAGPDGRVLYLNAAAHQVLGIPDDTDLTGTTISDGHPDWARRLIQEEGIPTAIRDGVWQARTAVRAYDGEEIPVSQIILAHKGPDGQLLYLSTIARDIRREEAIMAQLEAERARLKAIIDNAPEAIVVADAECRILLTNQAADQLYSRPVPYGQDYDQHAALMLCRPNGTPYDPRDLPLTRAALDGETLHDVQMAIVWPDGQQRDLLVNTAPIRRPDGVVTGAVGVFRDISKRIEMEDALRGARNHLERRVHQRTVELLELNETLRAEVSARQRAEQDLRASEERFRQLAEYINEVFWLIEPNSGQLLYVSPAYEAIWGQSRDRLYEDATAFLHAVHEDDRQGIREIWEQGWQSRETEFRLLRPDGTLRWIRARAFPIHDNKNRVYRIAGIAQDVTQQKQAEAALVQAERLGMAAQLAASLAHEINNPLQSVVGCLDLALEAMDAGREPYKYISVASKASERAARVIAQLRELHRRSRLEDKQATDINVLLDYVLVLCQKRCETASVEVVWEQNPDLPQLELMPDATQQIFLNLVTNAVDAMPRGGLLQVTAERSVQPPGIRIAFADTGTGMSPEVLERLFEPFHTTKLDGLGLGLFISQNIAQQHGGHIEVQSQAGKGTTFSVWLPA